jgi:hypothetical protein
MLSGRGFCRGMGEALRAGSSSTSPIPRHPRKERYA